MPIDNKQATVKIAGTTCPQTPNAQTPGAETPRAETEALRDILELAQREIASGKTKPATQVFAEL